MNNPQKGRRTKSSPQQRRKTTDRLQKGRRTKGSPQKRIKTTKRPQKGRRTNSSPQQRIKTTKRPQQKRRIPKKNPTQKKYEKYKPIGKNLVKEDFVCIFCFELPNLKDGRGVVICPHCRYPAHANEFHQWTMSSNLCSRCDSPLPIGKSRHLKIIPIKEYVKIITFFTRGKKKQIITLDKKKKVK